MAAPPRPRSAALLAGLLVVALAPAAVRGHGGDEGMDMSMSMGMGAAPGSADASNATIAYKLTYFAHPEHTAEIYAHIALMTVAWVFALPIAVMLSLVRSRYTLPAQLAFLATNAVGLLFGVTYNASTPDLYPNNAHHKVGWIATWVVSVQVVVGLLARVADQFAPKAKTHAFQPVSSMAMAQHNHSHSYNHSSADDYRFSNDSGQGTEPKTESLRSNSLSHSDSDIASPSSSRGRSLSFDEPAEDSRLHYDDDNDDEADRKPARLPGRLHRLALAASAALSTRAWRVLLFGYSAVDRLVLPLASITLALGVIAYGRFFEGHAVFSGLAHWIKGGVFFWLGIWSLGRWAGCFGEWGWAWNARPKTLAGAWRPSAEAVESGLILFYGCTNIFLEHLGSTDGAWRAQDLEHLSITVLFIGGGLMGLLVESARIRDLLNTTVSEAAHEYPEQHYHDEEREALRPPPQYTVSINPIPALVILLLGIMMSSHTQPTMISSMVHKQWGDLLLGASLARGASYVIMYLRPPTSILPSRPPTELLASFGLIAGGVIFMASSGDTVQGMIHYKLDAMFMYTVTMGLVGVLMSWELLLIALKGWAVRKERGRPAGAYEMS